VARRPLCDWGWHVIYPSFSFMLALSSCVCYASPSADPVFSLSFGCFVLFFSLFRFRFTFWFRSLALLLILLHTFSLWWLNRGQLFPLALDTRLIVYWLYITRDTEISSGFRF
jgi:hypothetical protein